MAVVDYKIVRLSHEGRHVSATVRVYRGSVQLVDVSPTQDGSQIVNKYTRIAKLVDRNYEYDALRDMTREEFLVKARGLLNQRLLTFAQANGHTIISEQQDINITDLEPVSNEVEI